jgi:hypothetical protein
MKKWFSFNSKIQRTEVVEPSKETFDTPALLFWTRGLDQWVTGAEALSYFLKPIEVITPNPIVETIIGEKKEVATKEQPDIKSPSPIICPVVTTVSNVIKNRKNIKKLVKKVSKKRKFKKNKKIKSIKKRPKTKALKKRKKSKKK